MVSGQLQRRCEVVPERLLDHESGRRLGAGAQPGSRERLGDRRRRSWRDREVEDPLRRLIAILLLDPRPEGLEQLRVVEVAVQEVEPRLERLPGVVLDPGPRVGRDRLVGMAAERLACRSPACRSRSPRSAPAAGRRARGCRSPEEAFSRPGPRSRRRSPASSAREGAPRRPARRGSPPARRSCRVRAGDWCRAGTASDSSSSSRASSAAPRTPASSPWRASLISVRSPTPGRM